MNRRNEALSFLNRVILTREEAVALLDRYVGDDIGQRQEDFLQLVSDRILLDLDSAQDDARWDTEKASDDRQATNKP